ncbi:homer protein homolog 2-like isoform X2 [Varroa destructor]|uniref:WH1 domain-containing protein n=1 Tax=Varroa destructor TaxID=109461 RepID=A0A7M7J198_VARDE|nr:homer protein homolog 2-like isoform X2 [Varroa destructor]
MVLAPLRWFAQGMQRVMKLTHDQRQHRHHRPSVCSEKTEQPMFSTKAHVFHIDPKTKRSWIPASSHAVAVSFFFDASRNLYRIISVEGTKAVINSTITPSMTFTKTSQKFGQWSDIRANTVYGLGFQTEPDLNQFIEKFQEVKEKTRVGHPQVQKGAANGGASGNEGSPSSTLVRAAQTNVQGHPGHPSVALAATLDTGGLAEDSPKHKAGQGGQGAQPANQLPQSTVEAQLRYENDRLKLALAQSSANAKKWEVELQTLKNNNARLTGALQESTANVEEWKRQLHALKDENTKMRCRELEIEASHGNQEALTELGRELAVLRQRNEGLDAELRQKEKAIETLRAAVQTGSGQHQNERHKALLAENDSLRISVSRMQEQLDAQLRSSGAATPGVSARQPALEQLSARLESKVSELRDLQTELAALVFAPPPPPQTTSTGSTAGPS